MTDLYQIALFPIPDLVAFPGTVVPLHVFEPRYRAMVHDSVDESRMIGVCHTQKQIRAARQNQTVEEALSSNQATYQPHDIFSAGFCEIVNTTEDGRIHANIRMEKRFELIEEVQTLPYRIVSAAELLDEPDNRDYRDVQQEISERIIHLVASQDPELVRILRDENWLDQTPAEFSFKVFQFLRLDADMMQDILASTRAGERLFQIKHILSATG